MSFRKILVISLIALSLVACGRHSSTSEADSSGPRGVQLEDGARQLSGKLLASVDGRIWMLDSGKWRRLSSGPGDLQPTWDPNGRTVYFVRKFRDYSNLYSVVPGKAPMQLTSNRGTGTKGTQQFVYNCTWALQPSAGRWGSVYMLTDRDGYITIARTTARNPRQIQPLTPRGAMVEDPQVSANGNALAYLSHPNGPGQIWVQELRGGGYARQVTRFKDGVYDPAWADRRGGLYFVAATGGGSNLYALPASGAPQQLTTSGAVRQPTSAGPGGRIVYLKMSGSGWDIWTAKVVRSHGKWLLRDEEQVTSGKQLGDASNLSFYAVRAK